MYIRTNIQAINAKNKLRINTDKKSKSMEKISSGLKINRAADNAAGLTVSEKMRGQIRGLNQASRNIQDGISLIQTAEGAMQEVHSMLQRMNELAIQAANGTYNDSDRANIQKEVEQLKIEIDNIAESTSFNGIYLLNGNTSVIGSAKSIDNPPNNKLVTITSPIGKDVSEILRNLVTSFNEAKNGRTGDADSKRVAEKFTMSVSNDLLYITCTSGDGFALSGGSPNLFFEGSSGNSYVYKFSEYINENDFIVLGDIGGTYGGDTLKFSFKAAQSDQSGLNLQIGTNASDFLTLDMPRVAASNIGVSDIDVSTVTGATGAIDSIINAIDTVSSERAKQGSYQNRLEHTMNNVTNYSVNLSKAESRIRDTDLAKEMMEYTKSQILAEAGQTMLAQANVLPQNVLRLLG
ncbi:flagellin [Paenibacillus sp. 32352]|uniref:flagellin N-terminal helical domain-containing protein n=1 Tax=Paenibacillus sp. 32352 TaxID=1969111 RepID=UPI0009ABC771|nr:flagellin [Paenibacillus sp. 32352]